LLAPKVSAFRGFFASIGRSLCATIFFIHPSPSRNWRSTSVNLKIFVGLVSYLWGSGNESSFYTKIFSCIDTGEVFMETQESIQDFGFGTDADDAVVPPPARLN